MKLIVYGEPIAKGRPKAAMRGKFPVFYTPKRTREAEDDFVAHTIRERPVKPLEGPVRLSIGFFKVKPKSYSKKIIFWTKQPDIDNLVKLVLDAMNKVFFVDDAQVVELNCFKRYDDVSRTEITIEEIK